MSVQGQVHILPIMIRNCSLYSATGYLVHSLSDPVFHGQISVLCVIMKHSTLHKSPLTGIVSTSLYHVMDFLIAVDFTGFRFHYSFLKNFIRDLYIKMGNILFCQTRILQTHIECTYSIQTCSTCMCKHLSIL